MPKESITCSPEARVQIGWRDHESVQIGVDLTDGRSFTFNGAGSTQEFTSLWADLDRHGCNRLIRLLRHARDVAYGADE